MTEQLSANERAALKQKGYSDADIDQALRELQMDTLKGSHNAAKTNQQFDPRANSQHSAFGVKQDDNLVKYQLEVNDILERAEHILSGDVPAFEQGHMIWAKNPEPENNTLNSLGVREIMQRLAMYINRNTILSDFEQEEIDNKALEFGKALNNLIFMKYEEFGIDNEEKMKDYPMIVLEVTDMVHAALKRALNGGERRSLREMIQISQNTQTQGVMGAGGTVINTSPQAQSRGLLNPMRYVGGKYK